MPKFAVKSRGVFMAKSDSGRIISTLEEEVNRWMNARESRRIGDSTVTLVPSFIYAAHHQEKNIRIGYENGSLYDETNDDVSHVSVEARVGDDFNGHGYCFNSETSSIKNTISDIRHIAKKLLGKSVNESIGNYFDGHFKMSIEQPQILNNKLYMPWFKKIEPHPLIIALEVPEFPEYNTKMMNRIAKKLSDEFSKLKHVSDSNVSYIMRLEEHHFVSSEGSKIVMRNWRAQFAFTLDIKDIDGRILSFSTTLAPKNQEELLNEEMLRYICNIFYKKAVARYDCPIQEAGTFHTIMDSEQMGTWIHEGLGGHLLSGKYLLEDKLTTFNLDKLNKQILPEFISLYDDPMLPAASHWNNFKYDDEGMPTQRKILVDHGVLKGYLTGRSTAAALSYILGEKIPPGNSRLKPTEYTEPEPRVSNLDIETSNPKSLKELKTELIRMCIKEDREYGIITEGSNGGFVMIDEEDEMAGFNATFPVFIYRIDTKGKIVPVKLAHTTGSAYTLLNSLQMLGKKKTLVTGFCNADSGSVPASEYSMPGLLKNVEFSSENPDIDRRPLLTDDEEGDKEISICPGGLNDKE
jgi:predicted Zn-dependent protease